MIRTLLHRLEQAWRFPRLVKAWARNLNTGFCRDCLFLHQELGQSFETIIDVGAGIGEYADAASFVYPSARVYAFEPNPESFAALADDPRRSGRKCFNLALSDSTGIAEFHRNAFHYSSSLLRMTPTLKEIFPFAGQAEPTTVRTERLEDVLAAKQPLGRTLLKIDVQGAELAVLAGAGRLLNEVRVIQAEVNFQPLYEGQVSLEDLLRFLKPYGFTACLQMNPIFKNHELIYSDFLFLKSTGGVRA